MLAELFEILRIRARKPEPCGLARGRRSAQFFEDQIDRFLREMPVSGQLAADDREKSLMRIRMIVYEMSARYIAASFSLILSERAHSAIGVDDGLAREPGRRDDAVRLTQQVCDLALVGTDRVRVAVVAYVRRPDQVQAVPGNDEEGPRVLLRLDVERLLRRAVEAIDDDVAALRAAYQAHALFALECGQDLIDPGAGYVHGDGCAGAGVFARLQVCELDAAHSIAFDDEASDARVGEHGRAVCACGEDVLQDEPLGILDLRVVG